MNAQEAYDNAYIVLKKPWHEGEATIATDASYSFYYATEVLEGRFRLGEKLIAKSPTYYKIYKNLFPRPIFFTY